MRRARWIVPVLLVVLLAPAGAGAAQQDPQPPPPPAGAPAEAAVPEGNAGPLTNVRSVTTGYYHSCALLTNRQVRCWGWNGEGELADGNAGTDTNRAVVTLNASGTAPLSNVLQISAGIYHTCALLTNHQVRCWGEGDSGQLGRNSFDDAHLPVAVRNPSGTANLANVVEISAGGYFTCARLANGQERCWGENDYGQLGNDTSGTDRPLPVVVRNPADSGPLTGVTSMGNGYYSACSTLENHQARCWGYNYYGQVGDGSDVDRDLPRVVKNAAGNGPLLGVTQVNVGTEVGCALLTNRQVRCWGDNEYGELGNDDAGTDSFLPVTVKNVAGTGPLSVVTQITVGDYLVCARLANSQARCWGDGEYGGMGDGTDVDGHDLPVVVLNPATTLPLSGVGQIDVGDYTACARLGGGQARCWGYGQYGNIGNGVNNYDQLTTAAVVT